MIPNPASNALPWDTNGSRTIVFGAKLFQVALIFEQGWQASDGITNARFPWRCV
jgi:hypothetical protein